ncbi:hypothetical protein AB0F68_00050 [Micromonospora sp. NPDC023966]|uniref:hypothetical protein n=1 Tax=Micromonospora sp. NPDC023966 TaxID=3154699 RepID=UPI0033C42FCA
MLFVGDDWAEDDHDVEIQDEAGRRLGKAKLEEGIDGIARLHAPAIWSPKGSSC